MYNPQNGMGDFFSTIDEWVLVKGFSEKEKVFMWKNSFPKAKSKKWASNNDQIVTFYYITKNI